MDSEKSDDDPDHISQQIVDYYKKYSQNKNLPKYFSGSSLSYMPTIVKEDEIEPPIVVIDDTNSVTVVELEVEVCDQVVDPKPVSPASSVASNRKLEWDNGADIGYSNYKLYKSASLPTVMGDMKSEVRAPLNLNVASCPNPEEPQIRSSTSSPSVASTICTTTSTSSCANIKPKTPSSSSSARSEGPPVYSSTSVTSSTSYLKRKIGSPDATSTPNLVQNVHYVETPFIPKPLKTCLKNRVVQLCPTRPTVVECFDTKTKGADKKIQTSVAEGLSKSVQTGDSLGVNINVKHGSHLANQSVIVLNYDSETEAKTSSLNTACDSFEYCDLRKSDHKSDSDEAYPVLSQLIAQRQSTSLGKDVDKSIELLQKLLKSRKYDAATKKRYIKKIVDKIVNNRYSEDSTASSDVFVPKKQDGGSVQKLQDNIPWYPPQLSKFTVKTFSDEFLPKDSKSSESYNSWKEDKTLSEKLLEEKHRGQGDHVVKFARKERQHQLAWINDEITHLTKLKGLLEKKVHTTTTVYMVSQQKYSTSSDSCSCTDSGRNYVIQTELSTSASSELPIDYNYRDKNGKRRYQVKDQDQVKVGKRVVGDIEVESDHKTTNIKIKTRKVGVDNATTRKPPQLVGGGKYDTFPKSKTEETAKPYTFEVPLQNDAPIKEKIREILSKYTAPGAACTCRCRCCSCGKKQEHASTQSDREKQVQTSFTSRDGSLQTKTSTNSATSSHQTSTTSTNTATNTSTSTSTSESAQSCVCCKRRNVTSKDLYDLRKKLSNQASPMCRPCYRHNRRCVYSPNFYSNPAHVCNCYTMVETKTLNEIKQTINDLNELDNQYCECFQSERRGGDSSYCKYCKCKLRQTSKNRNGIAYMLTFENNSVKEESKPKHRKKHLEEIKIKIPVAYKKKHKDNANNKRKKEKDEADERVTLQEYLNRNRPEFVQEAEDRRNTVNEARVQREEVGDNNKLMFLKKCQENCEKNAKRLFSAKEMKDITKRNYKKLPEVQQKMNDNRERQIRQANRLIADTFNKKLRENVLKGKRNLPTDVNVVNL